MASPRQRARWRQVAMGASRLPNLTRHLDVTRDEQRPAPTPPREPVRLELRCDRSGDLGSKHYWPDGAEVGDWCLCGKRTKLKPPPPL